MSPAERRKLLLYVGGGLSAVSSLAFIAGLINHQASIGRFSKRMKSLPDSEKMTADELMRAGVLPANSVVLSDKDRIVKALRGNADRIVKNPISRILQKAMAPYYAGSVTSGNNAVFIGNEGGSPVFGLPPGKMGKMMAMHEDGHRKAMELRGKGDRYVRAYNDADFGNLSDVFRPGRIKDSKGRLTRYGMENEAWDLAGVPKRNALRQAALGTYRAGGLSESIRKAALVGKLLGIGLMAYAVRKYPKTWYGGVREAKSVWHG